MRQCCIINLGGNGANNEKKKKKKKKKKNNKSTINTFECLIFRCQEALIIEKGSLFLPSYNGLLNAQVFGD